MKKLKWLRAVAFVLILSLSLVYVANCYSFPKSYVTRAIESFYDEKENTVDGVVIGTSVVGQGWATPVGWYEYGMTVYHLGSNIQPFGAITEIMDFALSRQDVKYFVIDLHGIRRSAIISSVEDKNLRKLYCSMHLAERYKMLNVSLDYAQRVYDYYGEPENEEDNIFSNKFSLYVPFFDFHNRWTEGLKKADYTAVKSKYKGAYDNDGAFETSDATALVNQWKGSEYTLDDFQKSEIDRLIDYINEKKLEVLFINYPSFRGEDEEAELFAASKYVKEKGFDVIDMRDKQIIKEIGLDLRTDIENEGHVNSKGACKITKYICSYLKENYEYEDHRGQPGYESWDKAVDKYDSFLMKRWEEKSGTAFSFKSEANS